MLAVTALCISQAHAAPDHDVIGQRMNADGGRPPVHYVQAPSHHAHSTQKTFKVGSILIEAPWLRATPKGAKVAGGYLKITNQGTEPDRLIGGSLEPARRFEVHEMTMVDNVMRMRPLDKGLEIKPGQSVELRPGGYHIMGMGLQSQLVQGRVVKGTLQFEKAGTVAIEYEVRAMGGGEHQH
jgi:copper(I)-binding protein